MPYAAEKTISTEPFDGAIEITQEQYAAAIQAIIDGKVVTIDGGFFAIIDPPAPEPLPEPEPPAPTGPMLSKVDFLTRLTEVPTPPILTVEESMLAMQSFPAQFMPALANWPTPDRLRAVKLWNDISFVPRDHPIFDAVLRLYQAQHNLSEAQATELGDLIFVDAV
jgi:hypothetical protein